MAFWLFAVNGFSYTFHDCKEKQEHERNDFMLVVVKCNSDQQMKSQLHHVGCKV